VPKAPRALFYETRMNDLYILLAIFAVIIFIVLFGLWAYRRSFGRAVPIPETVIIEMPKPPPKTEGADRDRRARVARMSSIGGDSRRR